MDLQHILLTGIGNPFEYKGSGRGNFDRFPRSKSGKINHGTKLANSLHQILWKEQKETYISVEGPGVYLDITSESGYELSLKSLDTIGCRLCNVREGSNNSQKVTVFIEDSKRQNFVKKLEKYKSQEGKRTNDRLFDNISTIELASLEDFWTSSSSSYPQEGESIWWEIWLSRRSLNREEVVDFIHFCKERELQVSRSEIKFHLHTVMAVKATSQQLSESLELISCLSELRKITDTARFILKQRPHEQSEWMQDLLSRTEFNIDDTATATVLILDHGINHNHPLLSEGVNPQYCFSWDENWPLFDRQHEHGTMQAGLTFYGDIATAMLSDDKISILYDIESCRILPPSDTHDKNLYGSLTYYAVRKAEDEIGEANRVVSMAITADHDGISGQPTSWSSEIDQLSFDGEHRRMFVLSAGNIRHDDVDSDYVYNVNQHGIEDPGQSWNALTVGAYTSKVDVIEHDYKEWTALSTKGDISPTSRTSNNWQWHNQAPIKPDVVEEGGNLLLSPDETILTNADCVSLITTSDPGNTHLFTGHGETSAATALVSRIAANIWSTYPSLWSETIRALITHSAEWSTTMLRHKELALQNGAKPRQAKELMLRMFGHGIPSMSRALASASNYLTMIVQDEITPYKLEKGNLKFDEMQLIELPWPEEELLQLGNTNCRLRVTLSYFVEPNPGRRNYADRFRYQSFGLRFKLINRDEEVDDFLQRTNIALREEAFDGQADSSGWQLGEHLRTRGSLHQDTWEGAASELTRRKHIAIVPVAGWWKQRVNRLYDDKAAVSVPYSLIVSIEVDADTDIYTPVATQVGVEPSIEVEVASN